MDLTSKIARKWSQIANYGRTQELQKRISESRESSKKNSYKENPKLSLILQFFNKRQNIKSIIEALRLTTAEEIIIIDDGSRDGSYEDWIKYLERPNDFLLRCNDLFEVRTYDRAISMARGEFICLLQDDDIPPRNNTWIEQALTLFDSLPDLLILGGRSAVDFLMPDPVDPNKPSEYERIGDIGGCPGVNKHRIYDTPLYREPTSGIPFMFATSANRAPTIIKRKPFLELGGINQEYAPFQFDDDDACVRAWLAGYQVGLYACPFVRDVGTGGMRLFNSNRVPEQAAINAKKFYDAYSKHIVNGYLQKLVDSANAGLIYKKEQM